MFLAGSLVVLLVAVSIAQSLSAFERERATAIETAAREAVVIADRVDRYFEERFESLTTIARTPGLLDTSPGDTKAWFEDLVATGSSFSGGLSLIGTDGIMILLSGFPLDEAPVDLSDRDYVQAVLSTGRPSLGDAIIGRLSGDPLLTFAVPVPDRSGATAAILAGTIRIDVPNSGLARLGATLEDAVIVDGAGQVVLDRGTVPRPEVAHEAFLAAIAGSADTSASTPGPTGDGSWMAGWAPIDGSDWRAVVLIDEEGATAASRRTLLGNVGLLGLVGMMGLVGSSIVGRRIHRQAMQEAEHAAAVQQRERFLRTFADTLPVMAGTLDDDLRTRFANQAAHTAGVADFREAVHLEDRSRFPAAASETRATTVDLRLVDVSSTAGVRWYRTQFVDAREHMDARWLFVATDIDDEKRAEIDMQRDLQERDAFLGLVSHELRTPLTVLIGNARTIVRHHDAKLPAPVADGLRDIEASAWQLQRILENMLVLSQLDAEDADPALEPQVLGRLVLRTVHQFQDRHPEQEIHAIIPEDLPIVMANPTFVDQVVWNLLSNGVKYAGAHGPIELEVHRAGDSVEVVVSDHGPGVPAEEIERIFDPHVRTAAAKGAAQGLGLGLSVCRRLVERQGGSLSARARPGGGMQFAFTLPRADLEEAQTEG
jgi:signal transduction histidine kinase